MPAISLWSQQQYSPSAFIGKKMVYLSLTNIMLENKAPELLMQCPCWLQAFPHLVVSNQCAENDIYSIAMYVHKIYWFCISGKILEDEKTVESYKIEEKNFVVIMVTKVSWYNLKHLLIVWQGYRYCELCQTKNIGHCLSSCLSPIP